MEYRDRYKDLAKKNAYENACDCLYYGYGRKFWSSCGLSNEDANAVWEQAFYDMVEGEEL